MPCTLAMTGCGSVVMVIIMRLHRAKSDSTSDTLPMARISLRSCPAQNPRPFAASTTTLTVGSAARRSKVDCSSSMSSLESALNWPGRLSVSVATLSFVSVSSRASVCVVAFDVMCVLLSERKTAWDQTVLVRLAFETLAKVRMRDADQRPGPFGDGFPLQIDHPVLGDDEHDVGTGCGDHIAWRQVQHDPAAALAALVGGLGEGDGRLGALRGIRAAHLLPWRPGVGVPGGAARVGRRVSVRARV